MNDGTIPGQHPFMARLHFLLTCFTSSRFGSWVARQKWLYAPSLLNFGYALRTTIASLIALGIALWWELGSPQWAPLTVWMIAQGSRGKSLAKARWHMFGMIVGTLIAFGLVASAPQQPLLFILLLSGFIGMLCFVGTLLPGPASMANYRMHGMRASGFTLSIISLDGIADPSHIFEISMARATYITLGIVCETVISSLFQFQLTQRARNRLVDNYVAAIKPTANTLGALLAGERDALRKSAEMMATLASLGDQIEFAEIEMGKHEREGDHARAALAGVAALFSRGLELAALMADPASCGASWDKLASDSRSFLLSLPDRLPNSAAFSAIMAELNDLRATSRVEAANCLAREMEMVTHPPVDVVAETVITREGQAVHILGDMLDELATSLQQFEASRNPIAHDHFRYPIETWRDWRQATGNSLRASVSMFVAGVIWITTAWPQGLFFLMFVGIINSLFSTLETPAVATRAFLHGTVVVTAVAAFMVILVMPAISTYEMMAMCFIPVMMVGGLAFSNPATILGAVAYNLFLTILVSPFNDERMLDEITFFNTAMPLFLTMAFCMWMYRIFLPLDPDGVRWTMRMQILQMLRGLARRPYPLRPHDVIGVSIERMVRLLNTVGGRRGPVVDAYLHGVLSGMTVGLAILSLREVMARGNLPAQAKRNVQDMLARMAQFTGRYGGHYGRTEHATDAAVAALVRLEQGETNLSQRVEILRALADLRVIAAELKENRLFFDASSPYLDPVFQ
ncbi:MAG: FUSC family protein [Acetobacter aceti]|nr:FUSC family protein [Acetobacter aceti]